MSNPERTCTGCRKKFPKEELIRVSNYRRQVRIDCDKKDPGRGAYVCPKTECFEKSLKSRGFNRAWHKGITAEQETELRKEFEEYIKMNSKTDNI